jgi:ammonium transporter, Amt family
VVIGIAAGAICYWGCIKLKQKLGYDDSLDVFGVHGIGGATGTLLVGVFAVSAIGEKPGLIEGNSAQLVTQIYGIAVTLIWSGVLTFVILKVINFFIPLRVRDEDERIGLDVTQHGEALQ